jgi:transposase
LPERVLGDKAYNSNGLDEEMADCGVAMIAAHRRNRTKPKTQDGRVLRRAKRRWKVERFFFWLQNFRRLAVRYECKSANFMGVVLLAATIIHVKHL